MATISSPRAESPTGASRVTSPTTRSRSNTPASSARLSIDLPASSNVNTVANAATAQRRNRAALRDYYNIKTKQGLGSGPPYARPDELSRTASITSATSESTITSTIVRDNDQSSYTLPTQFDDPSFDAEKYIAELLKTSSLREILKTESALVSEIRNLDGETKALVYDNYSKLIKAVGTIGEMQKGMREGYGDGRAGLDDVKGLEKKLESVVRVVVEMKNGTGVGNTDATKVNGRREERNKKAVVRWVLDAPNRLQDLVSKGEREKAEEEWKRVQSLLEKWAGVKGVEDVKRACEEAMKQKDNGEQLQDAG